MPAIGAFELTVQDEPLAMLTDTPMCAYPIVVWIAPARPTGHSILFIITSAMRTFPMRFLFVIRSPSYPARNIIWAKI
jgi:hypothetical protein